MNCAKPFLLILLIFCLSATLPGQTLQTVRIGVLFDGPWERNGEILDIFKKEIRDLLETEFDVLFYSM